MTETSTCSNEEEDIRETERNKKLVKIGKILFYGIIIVTWIVSANFWYIDIREGTKFFSSVWTYLIIVMTVFLIVGVLLPLYRNIREELKELKNQQK